MIEALKFVQGAVAKKDYQPALTHFRITEGRVVGYNGTIALSSPLNLDLTASPKAVPFVRAIERCTGKTTVVHLTPGGRLSLKSGKFQAFVECHEDSDLLDNIKPEGEGAEVPGIIMQAMKVLEPFMGVDASRPWSNGIMLRGQSAFATNNIVLAEYWLGQQVPELNIPSAAVREFIRIGEEPVAASLSSNNITFHYEGERWMRATLLDADWPNVTQLLDIGGDFQPFPDGFFEAVDTLSPFVEQEGRIYFRGNKISTAPEGEAGASLEVTPLPERGAYHYKHLASLNGIATRIDFTQHPRPCPFQGERIRGVIIGMVDA